MQLTRRRKILNVIATVASAAVIGLLIVFVTHDTEPSYNGKTLSQWTLAFDPKSRNRLTEDGEPINAIRHIGTNAIPHLLAWMDRLDHTRARMASTDRFWKNLPAPVASLKPVNNLKGLVGGARANNLATFSANAFAALGAIGSPAIPELIRRIQQTNSPLMRQLAVNALGYVGKEQPKLVVPILIMALDDSNTRLMAILALQTMARAEPELVVPALANVLQSNSLSLFAVRALASYGKLAQPAVPGLLKLLNTPDAFTRSAAHQALSIIAPEALTTAPPAQSP